MPRNLGFSDGSSMSVNRTREAGVRTLGFSDGTSIVANRTASVQTDPVGESRPLLSKVVGGASVAYSLRDLNDKQGENKVVNVRRSGDNEEKIFKAKEVPTIDKWVSGKQDTTLPCDVSEAAAAYSLRKVNSSHGTDIVKLSSLEDARLDDLATEFTTFGDRLTLPSGISIRNFKSNSEVTASRTYANGIVTLNVTSNGNTIAGGFNNTLRFEDLTPNKRYVIKGETRVIKDTITGTNPLATARVDINDQYNQVAIYPEADTKVWTSFSVVGDTRSPLIVNGEDYNAGSRFIDIAAQTGGTNISGEVTVQFKNIQIIEDPNYVVRIRRADNVEADVKFDSNDKLSLNSEVVNTHEDTNADGTSNGVRSRYDYDTGSTTARTLGDFLSESNFSDIAVNSFINSSRNANDNLNVEEFTPHTNGFTVEAKVDGMSTTDTVRCFADLQYLMSEADALASKFKVTFTIDEISGQGSETTAGVLYVKASNNIGTGGGSYFLQNTPNLTTNSDTATALFTTLGTHTLEGYSYQTGNTPFGGFSFVIYKGTRVKVSNIKYEVLQGASVNTWYNQATFNEDAVQQVASNQPRIAESGALLADGLNFDGTDDDLKTASIGTYQSSNGHGGFAVYKKDTVSTSDTFDSTNPVYLYQIGESLNTTTQAMRILGGRIYSVQADTNGDGSGFIDRAATPHTIGTNKTLSSIVGSNQMAIANNGVALSVGGSESGDSFNSTSNTFIRIGSQTSASRFFDGSIEELIIYKSDQSDNRFKIESNINNYYGLYNDANDLSAAFDGNGTITNKSKDGFTADVATFSHYVNATFNNSVATNETIYVSFNAKLAPNGGTAASPSLRLQNAQVGTNTSNQSSISEGFNSVPLTATGTSDRVGFLEQDDNVDYIISDFKVSRIARDGFVETWYDQSGNDRHASQDEEPAQPYIVRNGNLTKTENGTIALHQAGRQSGSGTTQRAGLASEHNPTQTDGALTEYSLFALYEQTNSDGGTNEGTIFSSGGAAGAAGYGGMMLKNVGGARLVLNNTDGNQTGGGSSSSASAFLAMTPTDSNAYNSVYGEHLISGHFKSGVGLIAREDGVTSTDTKPDAPIPHASKNLGQGKILIMAERTFQQTNPFYGRVSEVIFFEKDQRINTLAIEANINNQYSIY